MLVLGAYSDRAMGLLTIPKRNLLHHTAIIGQSGSGKSFAMARLIEELLLRTRARILILDPNGDFSRFHEPAEEVWKNPDFEPVLRAIGTKMPPGFSDYDSKSTFQYKWLSKRFQFVSADRRNWTPFRDGALAAPCDYTGNG